jgi:hypothetical protein
MTDLMAGEIVAALLLLVGVITLIALQGKDKPGPDVGVDIVDCGMVADVDEDIERPSLETIDLALRHMDRDNAGAVDWLLEKRLEAMRRAS